MADATPKPDTATDDDRRCIAALHAIAEGKLGNWQGLTPQCSRAHAEQALGPSRSEDSMGDLGGTPTPYRTYPGTAATPEGVMVWFRDQRIVLVGAPHPTLVESLETSLGAPEGKERSLLASGATQWIYASRGVVVHTWPSQMTKPFQLYAFSPMALDEFLKSWLVKIEIRRIRVRR